jgi:hypothetical protein
VRAAVQLLLVQACGQIYEAHSSRIPQPALEMVLKALQLVSKHAREVDDDMELRRALAFAQAEDQVPLQRTLVEDSESTAQTGIVASIDHVPDRYAKPCNVGCLTSERANSKSARQRMGGECQHTVSLVFKCRMSCTSAALLYCRVVGAYSDIDRSTERVGTQCILFVMCFVQHTSCRSFRRASRQWRASDRRLSVSMYD